MAEKAMTSAPRTAAATGRSTRSVGRGTLRRAYDRCLIVAVSAPAPAKLPPGPPLPKWLQTLAFITMPDRFVRACQRRYGAMITFRTAFDPGWVMVSDPALVKELFRGSPERLRAGEANALLGPVLGERSVLLLDGREHLRQRKLLLPPFHGERMRAHEAVMVAATDRAISEWPVGSEFRLLGSMQALTLEVIMRAVFGMAAGPREDELRARIRETLAPAGPRGPPAPAGRRLGLLVLALSGGRLGDRGAMAQFRARRLRMDALVYDEIARRRGARDLESRDDVLSMLLAARDEDGRPMTDEELRDELV